MTGDWRASVNQTPGAAVLENINSFISSSTVVVATPIDGYYLATEGIIKAATPTLLATHPALGPLMLVGFVSATENYFRDVLSQTLTVCPLAQELAVDQAVSLGAVLWHGDNTRERGAFEHLSFSSSEQVRKTSRTFVGFKIRPNSATEAALIEYDRVCELRHGIVHAGASLPGKNAIKLKVAQSPHRLTISVGYNELQQAAAVCTSLVAAFNSELFAELAERWAREWPRLPSWKAHDSGRRFGALWKIFRSQVDTIKNLIPSPMAARRCRAHVAKTFS